MEHIGQLDNLAPVISVVNIAGYLNPEMVDEETIEAIAESTGTPSDLVECVVDAVSDVNKLLNDSIDEDLIVKNFSLYLAKVSETYEPVQANLNAHSLAKIAFAMDRDYVMSQDTDSFAKHLSVYLPASFDNLTQIVGFIKDNPDQVTKTHNFSRKSFAVAALGKVIAKAADKAVKLGKSFLEDPAALKAVPGKLKEAVTESPVLKQGAKYISDEAKVLSESPSIKQGAKIAKEGAKNIQLAGEKFVSELPKIEERAVNMGKDVKVFIKDLWKDPMAMGLKTEAANASRLAEQKVLSKSGARLLNEVFGARAYELSNATLEVDLINDGIKTMKEGITLAAKRLKKGEISQKHFESLSDDFSRVLSSNIRSLENIKKESIGALEDLAAKNDNFVQITSDLLAKQGAGSISVEALTKNVEKMLSKMSGTFSADAVAELKLSTDKTATINKIVKAARSQGTKFNRELKKITDNFDEVQSLARNELTLINPTKAAALANSSKNALLDFFRSKPLSFRRDNIVNCLKSCTNDAAKVADQKYHAVVDPVKSYLKKIAITGAATALPAGMIYYGYSRDEDKALKFLVDRAEALKIQEENLRQQINAESSYIEESRRSIASGDVPTKSASAIGRGVAAMQNFAALKIPAIVKTVAGKLLFPIAPAVLASASFIYGVAAVKYKLQQIHMREQSLEAEILDLVHTRNELQDTLAEIRRTEKRFRFGRDYLGMYERHEEE